jgi:hypothetical protein
MGLGSGTKDICWAVKIKGSTVVSSHLSKPIELNVHIELCILLYANYITKEKEKKIQERVLTSHMKKKNTAL